MASLYFTLIIIHQCGMRTLLEQGNYKVSICLVIESAGHIICLGIAWLKVVWWARWLLLTLWSICHWFQIVRYHVENVFIWHYWFWYRGTYVVGNLIKLWFSFLKVITTQTDLMPSLIFLFCMIRAGVAIDSSARQCTGYMYRVQVMM